MVEGVGVAEYFGMGEAIQIIAILYVILYFSRKQMQSLKFYVITHLCGYSKISHQSSRLSKYLHEVASSAEEELIAAKMVGGKKRR